MELRLTEKRAKSLRVAATAAAEMVEGNTHDPYKMIADLAYDWFTWKAEVERLQKDKRDLMELANRVVHSPYFPEKWAAWAKGIYEAALPREDEDADGKGSPEKQD